MGKYKNRSALSTASVAVDDGNRFVIDIDNAEFFFWGGVNGIMRLLFSWTNDAFPSVGFVKA